MIAGDGWGGNNLSADSPPTVRPTRVKTRIKNFFQDGSTLGGIGCGGNRTSGIDGSSPDKGPMKPSDLAPDVGIVWDELRTQISSGVLRSADVHQLRTLAELLVQSKSLSNAAMADPSDPRLTRIWLGVVDQIRKLSMLFGLSPSDRARLKIEPESEPDELQQLLERRRARMAGPRPSGSTN